MKLTRHNGRAGKNGVYNPKHNDRSFDLKNSEHIDAERAKFDLYWDCYNGITSPVLPNPEEELATTFEEVEKKFYSERYQKIHVLKSLLIRATLLEYLFLGIAKVFAYCRWEDI